MPIHQGFAFRTEIRGQGISTKGPAKHPALHVVVPAMFPPPLDAVAHQPGVAVESREEQAAWTFVGKARIGRLATIDSRGFPSVVPFCFTLMDMPEPTIVSVLDEKPKRVTDAALGRVRNILKHPEVGLVIDHYDEDWSNLVFVQAKGIARLIEASDPLHEHTIVQLRVKYPQYEAMALEQRAVIAIDQLRLRVWRGDGEAFGQRDD